jgi:hypothetical protein
MWGYGPYSGMMEGWGGYSSIGPFHSILWILTLIAVIAAVEAGCARLVGEAARLASRCLKSDMRAVKSIVTNISRRNKILPLRM